MYIPILTPAAPSVVACFPQSRNTNCHRNKGFRTNIHESIDIIYSQTIYLCLATRGDVTPAIEMRRSITIRTSTAGFARDQVLFRDRLAQDGRKFDGG